MKYVVVSVRDRAADVFGQPMFCVSVGQGVRSFSDEINRGEGSIFSAHAEDFDLFRLVTFDDNTGMFETGVPEQVVVGMSLRVPKS